MAKHRLKDFERTLVLPGGTVVWQPIGFCRRVGNYGPGKWHLEPIEKRWRYPKDTLLASRLGRLYCDCYTVKEVQDERESDWDPDYVGRHRTDVVAPEDARFLTGKACGEILAAAMTPDVESIRFNLQAMS